MISTLLLNPLISQTRPLGGTGPRTSDRPGQTRRRHFSLRAGAKSGTKARPYQQKPQAGVETGDCKGERDPWPGLFKGYQGQGRSWVWGVGA